MPAGMPPPSRTVPRIAIVAMLGCVACTTDLGECDPEAARAPIFYDDNGYPAYPGQALLEVSCGAGAFCHSSGIETRDRFGAPIGIELDVGVALDDAGRARLAHAQGFVRAAPGAIYDEVVSGRMPPGGRAGEETRNTTLHYRANIGGPGEVPLPAIGDAEGHAMLRNWLACGAPLIEAIEGEPTGIGDIVARVDVCPSGQAECGGGCIDITSDPANCGGCGVPCGPEQRCADRRCECLADLDACGASCVELSSDVSHCGACDNACSAVCAMGACADSCPAGTTTCGGSCADLSTSNAHCGECGAACGAGETCEAGTCSCGTGTVACGGACVNVMTDPAHCGACDTACPAGSECVNGACACPEGTSTCDGACVDTMTDPAHCGGCGSACEQGDGCAGGACISCGPTVSFAADVQPIFTASCAQSNCHGARPQASLSLEAGRSWSELVGVTSTAMACRERILVVPGSEADSYLMNKLLGTDICGSQMPKRGESLSSAELDTIRAWICHGAAND